MAISYQNRLDGITADMLTGFFVGWPNPPDSATHLRILEGSAHFVLALDNETMRVVGFISAISDGVCCAFIPNLEVLPEYQGQGIGSELVKRVIADLNDIYAIDLLCDPDLQPYYQRLGFQAATGMLIRNYHNQSGLPATS